MRLNYFLKRPYKLSFFVFVQSCRLWKPFSSYCCSYSKHSAPPPKSVGTHRLHNKSYPSISSFHFLSCGLSVSIGAPFTVVVLSSRLDTFARAQEAELFLLSGVAVRWTTLYSSRCRYLTKRESFSKKTLLHTYWRRICLFCVSDVVTIQKLINGLFVGCHVLWRTEGLKGTLKFNFNPLKK